MFNFVFSKIVTRDNVEKYGRARQATDDNIIRRMRFARWITNATETHSEYVTVIAFAGNSGASNGHHYVYTCIACYYGSVLKDTKSSVLNISIFICQSSDDWCHVSQARHHSNNEVEQQLWAETQELKEKLAERERCLSRQQEGTSPIYGVFNRSAALTVFRYMLSLIR
jgi:hypothetical protein